MKKVFLSIAFLTIALIGQAQKANIQSVINYLKTNEIAEAKKLIDETVLNESTANNAKAWLLKAVIYQAIGTPKDLMPQLIFMLNEKPYALELSVANTLQASTPNANKIALEAYQKSFSIDPKYSKDEIFPLLQTMLGINFNNAITEMNDNKYEAAYKSFGHVVELSKLDAGKIYAGTGMDTIFANAKLYQGNCAYQLGQVDNAIPLFEEVSKSPYINSADLYVMLADIYEGKKNDAKWQENMKQGKSKFPNDKRLVNSEINYYSNSGKSEELIVKLKEGIALEPKKTDLYIILGQTYYNMANPNKGDRPANAKELEQNALTQYNKVMELEPNNYYGQFYTGLLYFNQAKTVTDEMNKADDKKYEAMKPVRDGLLAKCVPFLEKAKTSIEAEQINDSNKETYKQVLSGLLQTYNITGKSEKATAIQALMNKTK
jgi:predicted Zn-dependent protease